MLRSTIFVVFVSILLFSLPLVAREQGIDKESIKEEVSTEVVIKTDDLTNKELIVSKANKALINPQILVDIAWCESQHRQYNVKTGQVLRGLYNPQDVGLFQINEYYHLKTSQNLGFNIYTREGNIDYAIYLYKQEGTRPWVYSKSCHRL